MSAYTPLAYSFAQMMGPGVMVYLDTRTDWNDVIAMKGAREVLEGVKYPGDDARRSLYASWLRVLASCRWRDSFDHLMLECVVATPSVSKPETPLYVDIFKARDPIDRPFPNVLTPVLDLAKRPRLFSRKEPVEPLPSSPGLVDFLADLLRKSRTSRAALDEAGLIIGFYSLALATIVAKPASNLQDFFRIRMKSALSAAVPTSFEGEVFCPGGRFLAELSRKAHSIGSEVKPYIVLLVLGQHCFHANAMDAAPRADMKFLEEGFLKGAKFGQLKIVELLYEAQEKTGIGAALLNRKLRTEDSSCDPEVTVSSHRVEVFLEGDKELSQRTKPWCRAANKTFFMYLEFDENLAYAMRLTALVAPDPGHQLWQRPQFADVDPSERAKARLWATKFRRAQREADLEETAKSNRNRHRHDSA
ncbi:uncharacterized protein [Dermacentor albipictus]|uniref:uncharacterized protein isoform X1 n=1 Tax=Dermacentor albipictus TaxID=60249 RepID=UPI0038FC4E66